MKKSALVALALCLCLIGGSVATSTAATTVVAKTKVKVKFSKGTPPYSESTFNGKVKGKKPCRAKRKVSIKGVGKAKTNKKGGFTIATSNAIPPGKYVAKVKKKKAKKGAKVYKCKKGKSKPITVS